MHPNRMLLLLVTFMALGSTSISVVQARAKVSIGAYSGVELPISDRKQNHTGLHVEADIEAVENALMFSFKRLYMDVYTVGYLKKFFPLDLESAVRPYFDVGFGINVVDYPERDLFFGITPVLGMGLDLALSNQISVGVVARYNLIIYFVETDEGRLADKHTVTVAGGLKGWF